MSTPAATPPQPPARKHMAGFLKSPAGVLRLLQVLFGGGLWVTIAANKYEGSIHFVLLVAVLFWLLTLALFAVTLLDKQDLVPVAGGPRWLLSNLLHDAAAAALYAPAVAVMAYKTQRNEYCNLTLYRRPCLYKVYLTAAVFAGLGAAAYLLSAALHGRRKCRGEETVF
ncbi:unnamed protein product [Merluccius merluccius]